MRSIVAHRLTSQPGLLPVFDLDLPIGAEAIGVQMIGPRGLAMPVLYVLGDPEAPLARQRFAAFAVGMAVPPLARVIGGFVAGPLVWHLFAVGDDWVAPPEPEK